jgi:hypothetical protein
MSKTPNISSIITNLENSRQELLEAQSQLSAILQQYDMIENYGATPDPNSDRPTIQHFKNDIEMLKENVELFREKMDRIQNQLNTITKITALPSRTRSRSRSRSRTPSPHKGSPRGGRKTRRKKRI